MDRDTLIIDTDLTVRTKNLLLGHASDFGLSNSSLDLRQKELALKHLEGLDLRMMKRFKGFGKRTIKEVVSVCDYVGINTVGFEDIFKESDYKIISINTQTKSGKALYDLARLLQEQDGDISIADY